MNLADRAAQARQPLPGRAMYSVHIQWSADDAEFVATCPEFPGLSALAPTAAEAASELYDAIDGAVDAIKKDGESLPKPQVLETYSGQFRLRVPRSMHRALVTMAEREGVSLNALVTSALAKAIAASS